MAIKNRADLKSSDLTRIPSGIPDGVIASEHRDSNADAYDSSVNFVDEKLGVQTDLSNRKRLGATQDFEHSEGDGNTFVTYSEAQNLGGQVDTVNGVSPVTKNISLTQDDIPDGANAFQFTTADILDIAGKLNKDNTGGQTVELGGDNLLFYDSSNGSYTTINKLGFSEQKKDVNNIGTFVNDTTKLKKSISIDNGGTQAQDFEVNKDGVQIKKVASTAIKIGKKILLKNGVNIEEIDENLIGGGNTNLSVVNKTATTLDVASDTGTDATIPSATDTEAGLLPSASKLLLNAIQRVGDYFKYAISPVIPPDVTGDLVLLPRTYADSRYLRTTGSLPTTLVFVSPTGNDATGQNGNQNAPFTVTGGVTNAVSGDTIVFLAGTYSAITTNLFKYGVSYTTYGTVNLTFTTGGGVIQNLPTNFVFNGDFNVTSTVDVFTLFGTGTSYISLSNITQTANSLVTTTAGGHSSYISFKTASISGTGQLTKGSYSIGQITYINCILVNTSSSNNALTVASRFDGNISSTHATVGPISQDGFMLINGNITQTAGATSNITGKLNGNFTGGTLSIPGNYIGIKIYGNITSATLSHFNSNSGLSFIQGEISSSIINGNPSGLLTMDSCRFTNMTIGAGGNTNNSMIINNCTGNFAQTNSVSIGFIIITDSTLTVTTATALFLAVQTRYIINNSKITGNNALGLFEGVTGSKIEVNDSTLTNSSSDVNSYVFKSFTGTTYQFKDSKIISSFGKCFSVDNVGVPVLIEGNCSFSPKLNDNYNTQGSDYNAVKIRRLNTNTAFDFDKTQNGIILSNIGNSGMTITNTNFVITNNFKYCNLNASTVTITLTAPLVFLNGTTSTTKTIAQNEIFEFINLDGTNVIIK